MAKPCLIEELPKYMDKPLALIIEEDRNIAALFRHVTDLAGFRTEIVFHDQVVMERLSKSQPGLVVLDLDLPGVSASQVLEIIRKEDRLRPTKVIAVTSNAQMAEGLSAEPDLLLFKPISIEQFSDFIERFQLRIKYQTTIPMVDEPWDRVTGVYNQSFFATRLENTLQQSKTVEQYLFAVLTVNFDQNGRIKNQLDIRNWISALRETAETLKSAVRSTDTIARFDQDNFYILIENLPNKDVPKLIAARIYKKLKERLEGLDNSVQFPIQIGILVCDDGFENAEEILEKTKTGQASEEKGSG